MLVVVSYDIKDDKRRTRVHKALMSYGQWVQYSVFECDLEVAKYLKLRDRLSDLIKPDDGDSIRFYNLCGECGKKVERVGGVQPLSHGAIFV